MPSRRRSTRPRHARPGPQLLAILALLSLPAAEARPQAAVGVINDTFFDYDLDGDGFGDVPLPPIGTPEPLDFESTVGIIVERSLSVPDNGMSIDVDLEFLPGDADLSNAAIPFYAGSGAIRTNFDATPIPSDGYARARHETIASISSLTVLSLVGGFAGGTVDLRLEGRASGTVDYIHPRYAGFQLSTSFVFDTSTDFEVRGFNLDADGTATGDPELVGGAQFTIDPATLDGTWSFSELQIVIDATVDVPPGATSVEVPVEFRQFYEFGVENFGGSAPETVLQEAVLTLASGGLRLDRIVSTTPGVAVVAPVPEPTVAAGLPIGIAVLAALGRRPRSRRRV